MAKVPIAEVKQTWRDVLSGMFAGIPIHAAWPGDDLFWKDAVFQSGWKAAIYFGPATCTYERHSMRADRQRRIVHASFPVVICVEVSGESNDQGAAALLAEQTAYDLWQPIDEDVADEKHLWSPTLVASAVVDGDNPSAGATDSGWGYRLEMPVIAQFRIL